MFLLKNHLIEINIVTENRSNNINIYIKNMQKRYIFQIVHIRLARENQRKPKI
jgi:ribosomal protein L21E